MTLKINSRPLIPHYNQRKETSIEHIRFSCGCGGYIQYDVDKICTALNMTAYAGNYIFVCGHHICNSRRYVPPDCSLYSEIIIESNTLFRLEDYVI
jgi:hypothetical protein